MVPCLQLSLLQMLPCCRTREGKKKKGEEGADITRVTQRDFAIRS